MNKDIEIEKINSCIADLVYEKTQIKKAYNYYHCIRDEEQFRHLEENYGLGTPTSVGFTPLIKKHIDVLIGEYLELDPDLQISCKDEKTVSNIMRDEQLKIDTAAYNFYKEKLQNAILQVFQEGKEPVNDPYFEQELNRVKNDVAKSYVSEYELAAQNILNYAKHSRDIDMKNKMRELLTDLLVTGTAYYRVKPSNSSTSIKFEALNPNDTFVERNYSEFYLNKSPRAVVRRWMTREQILVEFGDELSSEAKEKISKKLYHSSANTNEVYTYVTTSMEPLPQNTVTPGILGGLEVSPFRTTSNNMYNTNTNLICVYECEWLVYDEKENRLTRHEGVKIGDEIYIVRGESKYISRSISNPKDCTLSINGAFLADRNGDPFSIVLNTMDLQDRYDLVIFFRDSLLASSGTTGDWVDIASMPSALGVELPDRLQKWLAYKKQGLALYDSSQDGANLINTAFNGYDDSVRAQAVQAFEMVLQSIEQQASSITGVFAQKLGGIQQRDAVSNVKVGIRQSSLLTKQYFSTMDAIYKEVNYDILNLAKFVFKKGFTGTIINGTRLNQIFTALPEYYTMTDFDIHILDSTESFQDKQVLQATSTEMIKAGLIDPTMVFNIMTSKNITELKGYINDAVASKKQENDMIGQLKQQLDQITQQAKELQKQNQQLQEENKNLNKTIDKNSETKLNLEKQRIDLDTKKAKDDKEHNEKLIEVKEKQLQLEASQLFDNNPYNDAIKNV